MAHKTLVGGTAYNITGGKSMVSGTAYNITGGKTMIGGTGYNIGFAEEEITGEAYAHLYSDGSFIFKRNNDIETGKTLRNSYTDFENVELYTPLWDDVIGNITNVYIYNKIAPVYMDGWFNNSRKMKTFDFANLNTNRVISMDYAYRNCTNLTGSPVCGRNVQYMAYAYENCYNLTGSPVCGNNVINMDNAYTNCRNLTGSPVCGDNVYRMSGTYRNCFNLTGSPVCGKNVSLFSGAYNNCRNLTGFPVCGKNVDGLDNTYRNCINLTGCIIVGNQVSSLDYAYHNCQNIGPNMYIYSSYVQSVYNCFGERNRSKGLDIYVLSNSRTNNTFHYNNTKSIVGKNITWTNYGSYQYELSYNICLHPVANVLQACIDNGDHIGLQEVQDINMYNNTTKICLVQYVLADTSISPQFSITSNDESIVSASNIKTDLNRLEFTLNSYDICGTATITLTMTQGSDTRTRSFTVTVENKPKLSWSVESVSGASYGFDLNSNGYYESKNKGVNTSYALCKVNILSDGIKKVIFDCINYAESNYDYGILSTVDKTLTASSSADSSNVYKSFKGSQSASIQSVDYGVLSAGNHFVYVKFVKDSSQHSNNDTLQFKVRFE